MSLTEKEVINLPNGALVLLKESTICPKVKNVVMVKVGYNDKKDAIMFKARNGNCVKYCKSECTIRLENLEIRNTFENLLNRNGANK